MPAFSASLATYTLATFVAFGVFVFIAPVPAAGARALAAEGGLWTMPFAVAFIVGSMLTPLIARRVRTECADGRGSSACGDRFRGRWNQVGDLRMQLLVTDCSTIYSLGLAPVFTLATDMIVGTAPPERAGAASAISETGSELGGALGIAILGSLGTAVYRGGFVTDVASRIPSDVLDAARGTLGAAVVAADQLPSDLQVELLSMARAAFTDAMQLAAVISVAIVIITASLLAVLLRRRHVRESGAAFSGGGAPTALDSCAA